MTYAKPEVVALDHALEAIQNAMKNTPVGDGANILAATAGYESDE